MARGGHHRAIGVGLLCMGPVGASAAQHRGLWPSLSQSRVCPVMNKAWHAQWGQRVKGLKLTWESRSLTVRAK